MNCQTLAVWALLVMATVPRATADDNSNEDTCGFRPDSVEATLKNVIDASGVDTCAMKPGQEKTLFGNAGTGVKSQYTLRRLEDAVLTKPYQGADQSIAAGARASSYEVTVDLKFATRAVEFEDRARKCYEEAAPVLRGPSGEFLQIKLFKDNPGVARPKAKEIKIVETGRANAATWTSDAKCPLILHETMHLLGLCDEYKEKWKGAKVDKGSGKISYSNTTKGADGTAFDCRVLGPIDSLMSKQDYAYDAVFGIGGLVPRLPTRPSLLYPAEFDAIVAPSCPQLNNAYYSCATQAYMSSVGDAGCSQDLPAACSNPDWVGKY